MSASRLSVHCPLQDNRQEIFELHIRHSVVLLMLCWLALPRISQAADPVPDWVAFHQGAGNSYDSGQAIAVDGAGNIYVTGNSYDTSTSDYTTVKYAANGTQLWVARYNGPRNSVDFATAIAVDSKGNVYVTGSSRTANNYDDYATIKYSPTGKQLWVARYNSPTHGNDAAADLAIDRMGNVYVTGRSINDYATVKYNSAGRQLWVRRYSGFWMGAGATAIAVDNAGNAYVTGSRNSGRYGDNDLATVKYAPDGRQLWIAIYNEAVIEMNKGTDIAVDNSGNVYVTGHTNTYRSFSSYGDFDETDFVTIKYDASGRQRWKALYNGPANGGDYAQALALDGAGNVYVTGFSNGQHVNGDYINANYTTVKYNTNGARLWVAHYNGPANNHDHAFALAVDRAGNAYVTGTSMGSGTNFDYAVIKYSAAGREMWQARYNGPGNYRDGANAIAVDPAGNVVVTGGVSVTTNSYKYATIKYPRQ